MKKLSLTMLTIAIMTAVSSNAMAADVPQGTVLAKKQELVIGNGTEPASFDPGLIDGVPGSHVADDLFEPLVTVDENGKIIPGVAMSWTKDPSGKVYTFKLRKNAKWSDGSPVTSKDFVYSWKRLVSSPSSYQDYLASAGVLNAAEIVNGKKDADSLGVKAVDPYTFEVTLKEPNPAFVKMLVHCSTDPLPQKVIAKWGDQWTKPEHIVGNGAYKLKSHVVNGSIVLERNPDYWDNAHTVINQVTYLPIQEKQDLNRYKANEEDITYNTINSDAYPQVKKDYQHELNVTPYVGMYYYVFNVNKPPFNDVRVRKALSYLVNREALSQYVTGHNEKPLYHFAPTSVEGFKPEKTELEKIPPAQRIKIAEDLLKKAGYDQSHPLVVNLMYNSSDWHKKIATAVASMWNQTGFVQTKLDQQEWKAYLDNLRIHNFDVARKAWIADYNDPSAFFNLLVGGGSSNDGDYRNTQFDQYFKESQSASPSNRAILFNKMDRIVNKDAAVIPMFEYNSQRLVKPYVKGLALNDALDHQYVKNFYIIKH
ncbi:oligopeptide ABC transporter substrate-binding protein OppA [Paraphotobacterium marinum]|uniref:Oligopeptide ABC transporter substrate-binding protein OppA n=1 Tax=Paraphotobacterium marinum TaxID=1755811 RepID=A0A220VFI8_9GAMM|nr:ABC transporter substrate-binding protein [Paraphotobacterium marinum]ASK79071.1 oligopeptide ABC transporter substrate-binding protein OppA [Paraphotobacterium marinum]